MQKMNKEELTRWFSHRYTKKAERKSVAISSEDIRRQTEEFLLKSNITQLPGELSHKMATPANGVDYEL